MLVFPGECIPELPECLEEMRTKSAAISSYVLPLVSGSKIRDVRNMKRVITVKGIKTRSFIAAWKKIALRYLNYNTADLLNGCS